MPRAIPLWRPRRLVGPPTKEVRHYRSADWRARRQRILLRDAFRCFVCGLAVSGRDAHVDHALPLEDGGTDADDNLRTLCAACHGRKTIGEQRRRGVIGGR